jgi:hypothetical protein
VASTLRVELGKQLADRRGNLVEASLSRRAVVVLTATVGPLKRNT